jgi:hypothetical protein
MPQQGVGFRRKCASPSGHPVQSPVTQPTEIRISARPHARYGSRLKERRQPRDELPKHKLVRRDCSQLSVIRLAAEVTTVKHYLTAETVRLTVLRAEAILLLEDFH